MATGWQAAGKAKHDATLALIPSAWKLADPPLPDKLKDPGPYIRQHLTAEEVQITETDAVGIAAKTTTGAWKALDVIHAFAHRAALAHQLTNCLLEIFFEDAYVQAQQLDQIFASTGKPVGPLHGVPVSLKDQFHVRGVETTMGYVGWIGTFQGRKGTGKERVFESLMVQELRALGAVLYCKTTLPATLMAGESLNNIAGYCWNSRNRNLTSGGSSGGEGALIGLRGSPLGIGSDIGGSIRIPAAFNGLYGLRPSTGRLPYEGAANSMDGQNSIPSVVGPLAATAASLRLGVVSILATQPWLHDPLVHEIPYRFAEEAAILDATKSGTRLAFGLLAHDGTVSLHPPVRRALELVAATARRLGHEVVPWLPPAGMHERLYALAARTWGYDGGKDVHGAFGLSGEPVPTPVQMIYGTQTWDENTGSFIAETNVLIREARQEYLEYWNSTSSQTASGRAVDAVIAPVAPFAAARPGAYTYYGYSGFVNVLDYASGVLPVTAVDKRVDTVDAGFVAVSELDRATQALYDPEIYDGAHVSVQIIGRRLHEERVLGLLEVLGRGLQA